MNIVEQLRKKSIQACFEVNSFSDSFPVWKEQIEEELGEDPDYRDLVNLGDNLKEIFTLTGNTGRGQSEVSTSGYAWEPFVCWYLNLCLIGTRTVVIKNKKDLVPEPIKDGITVKYDNYRSNSEPDLLAITFPHQKEVTKDREEISNLKPKIDELAKDCYFNLELMILQCKTNWKENVQAPMLWGIIYSSGGLGHGKVTVGSNNYRIEDLENFYYGFVTVPTHDVNYGPDSVPVKRLRNLSGGNYWGKETKSSVADSLKEIFNSKLSSGWDPDPHKQKVAEALESSIDYSYFDLDVLS